MHALTNPEEYRDLMQSSLGQGLTFLFSFICLIGAGFGFVLANFERIARRMEEMASTDGLTGCLSQPTVAFSARAAAGFAGRASRRLSVSMMMLTASSTDSRETFSTRS